MVHVGAGRPPPASPEGVFEGAVRRDEAVVQVPGISQRASSAALPGSQLSHTGGGPAGSAEAARSLAGAGARGTGDPGHRGAHSEAVASPAGMDPWLTASLAPRHAWDGGGRSAATGAPPLPWAAIPLGARGGGSHLL